MVDVNIVIISGRDVDDLKAKVTDFDVVIVVVVVAAAVVLVIVTVVDALVSEQLPGLWSSLICTSIPILPILYFRVNH